MEIRDVDYFLAVAGQRSFSAAARELHISQPALSRYIANLERRLGLKLFDRTGKQLLLTLAGDKYLALANEIREKVAQLDLEMKNISAMQKQRLHIGMVRNGRQLSLTGVIASFRELYPAYSLHIKEMVSKDLELAVLQGKYDIGFISEPTLKTGLDCLYLGDNFTLLAAPAGMPQGKMAEQRDGMPYPWIDLFLFRDEEFIFPEENSKMRFYIGEIFRKEKFVPQINMFTQGTVDALRFTELGVGISFITDGYIPYISDSSKVDLFCVGNPPAKTPFNVISKKGNVISKPARDFIKLYVGESVD